MSQTLAVSLADTTSQNRRLRDLVFLIALWLSLLLALVTLTTLVVTTLLDGAPMLNRDFLTFFPSPFPEDSGIQSALFGSLWVTITSGIVSLVFALGTAIYLEEFADPRSRIQRLITLNIQTLAGVPSIVYGILGLAFVVRSPLNWGFTVGSAAATLTMMVLPLMIVATREALKAVPPSLREGSYAQIGRAHV